MRPWFRNGDHVESEIVPFKSLCPGDVIAFKPREDRHTVIHRIISIHGREIKTQGDSNLSGLDPWIITPDDWVERVSRVTRNGKVVFFPKGMNGVALAKLWRWVRRAIHGAETTLHPLYVMFQTDTTFHRFCHRHLPLRVFTFGRGQAQSSKIRLGAWRIATKASPLDEWKVKKPFRLILNPNYLQKVNKSLGLKEPYVAQ